MGCEPAVVVPLLVWHQCEGGTHWLAAFEGTGLHNIPGEWEQCAYLDYDISDSVNAI